MPFKHLLKNYEAEQLARMARAYTIALPSINSNDLARKALAKVIVELFAEDPKTTAENLSHRALLRFKPGASGPP